PKEINTDMFTRDDELESGSLNAQVKHFKASGFYQALETDRKEQQQQRMHGIIGSVSTCPPSPDDLPSLIPGTVQQSRLDEDAKLNSSSSEELFNQSHTPATTVSSSLTENTSYPSVPSLFTASSSVSDNHGNWSN